MKTILITGVGGFVGRHLSARLVGRGYNVVGFDRSDTSWGALDAFMAGQGVGQITKISCDLERSEDVRSLFEKHEFDAIIHLAGISFPPIGWQDPARILAANAGNTAGLLAAARATDWRGRFLFVSSSDVYGRVPAEKQPITEDYPVQPDSPYGASKAAAELFVRCLSSDGIEAIIARPFNHIGPGQASDFVLPSFLKRIRECMETGQKSIATGDLASARDFTDVRDVVAAYELLLLKAQAGNIYNICSGQGTTIRQLLDLALAACGAALQVETDQSLLRPDGTTVRFGSAARLKELGWSPAFALEETVRDTAQAMGIGKAP